MNKSNLIKLSIALFVAITLWASAFVGIRVALKDFSPNYLSFFRIFIATIIMLPFVMIKVRRLPSKTDLLLFLFYGVIGFTAYQLLISYGERTVNSASASLLITTAPIMTLILSNIFSGERSGIKGMLGSLIGFSGSMLIIFYSQDAQVSFNMDAILILLAALTASIYSIAIKSGLKKYSVLEITAYSMLAGTLTTLPFTPEPILAWQNASFEGQLVVLFLGIGPTAIAFTAWSYAISYAPVSKVVPFTYSIPAVTAVIAWVWLTELPNLYQVLGGIIIVIGVYISSKDKIKLVPPRRTT